MKLTDSTAAKVGATAVTAIASSTPSTLQFKCYATTQVQSAQLGSLNLEKNGTATLQLSGTGATYAGAIKINEGAFEIGNSSTLNGVISGNGSVIKTTPAAHPTLNAINTYSGGTSLLGIVTILATNSFGTGLVTGTGGWDIRGGGAITLSNNFTSIFPMGFRITGGNPMITGIISGTGNLQKLGNGFLSLNASLLTYTGSTSTIGGRLIVTRSVGLSTATASFTSFGLSVVFDVSPPSGVTNFQFFQGTTVQSYAPPISNLTGVPAGTTATYNSATSTLSVTVP